MTEETFFTLQELGIYYIHAKETDECPPGWHDFRYACWHQSERVSDNRLFILGGSDRIARDSFCRLLIHWSGKNPENWHYTEVLS